MRALVVLLLLVAACSAPRQVPPGQQAPSGRHDAESVSPADSRRPARPSAVIRLSAALVSPVDIVLRWDGRDPDAAGHVLEFATEPQGPYTVLAFLPPEEATYTHPDLIPGTTFHYRLRPYRGRASAPVDVTIAGGPRPEPAPGWSRPRTVPGAPRGTRPTGSGDAAPADLKATVTQADGVAFTWTDRARDEEGFLLENRPAGRTGFRVVAALDPDVNAFGLVTLPEERQASYRVRAIRYGTPSNVVRLTTGGD
ncbi:hypothetical protein [Nonomuraea sp. NPDC049480]|uniref:hypothetical protein n=1 Tax=Nonomuraea sp. NPDC049480 TaxID=3364353 RepID=UPI0037888507